MGSTTCHMEFENILDYQKHNDFTVPTAEKDGRERVFLLLFQFFLALEWIVPKYNFLTLFDLFKYKCLMKIICNIFHLSNTNTNTFLQVKHQRPFGGSRTTDKLYCVCIELLFKSVITFTEVPNITRTRNCFLK